MIVAHLDDQARLDRLPFARAFGAPAARSAGRLAGEAGAASDRLEAVREIRLVLGRERRGEADMVELAVGAVETDQQ